MQEMEEQQITCVLSEYECDLNLTVSHGGYTACPRTDGGFANMWAGVKATHGVTKGKVCFEVEIKRNLQVPHMTVMKRDIQPSSPFSDPHVVRIGWSTGNASLELGYTPYSYGYGGTGKKKSHRSDRFIDYGECFGELDVITAYLDFEGRYPTISFSKCGVDCGIAFTLTDADLQGQALFPHVMVKNTEIEVNLGQKRLCCEPHEGFTFIGSLPTEELVCGPRPPASKKDCEVLMMVGLPGCGKTRWAEQHCREHPEKKYHILGTNDIMDRMKVDGLRRKGNYQDRHKHLYKKANDCLKALRSVASRRRGNYIIDQTNVYRSARERKHRDFCNFQCKAIVIVPSDEDFMERTNSCLREKRKIPDEDMLKMIDNFELPERSWLFSEVQYPEMQRPEAKELLLMYRSEGYWGCGNFGVGRLRLGSNRRPLASRPNERSNSQLSPYRSNLSQNSCNFKKGSTRSSQDRRNFPQGYSTLSQNHGKLSQDRRPISHDHDRVYQNRIPSKDHVTLSQDRQSLSHCNGTVSQNQKWRAASTSLDNDQDQGNLYHNRKTLSLNRNPHERKAMVRASDSLSQNNRKASQDYDTVLPNRKKVSSFQCVTSQDRGKMAQDKKSQAKGYSMASRDTCNFPTNDIYQGGRQGSQDTRAMSQDRQRPSQNYISSQDSHKFPRDSRKLYQGSSLTTDRSTPSRDRRTPSQNTDNKTMSQSYRTFSQSNRSLFYGAGRLALEKQKLAQMKVSDGDQQTEAKSIKLVIPAKWTKEKW